MSSSSSSSISSASLLVSPSDSSVEPPSYGWDQVQDILDDSSSSSSSDPSAKSSSRRKSALNKELDLAMADLSAEQRHKLSILMKAETTEVDSDESDQDLFASPSLIHAVPSPRRASTTRSGGSPRRIVYSPGKRRAGNITSSSSSRPSPSSISTGRNNPMQKSPQARNAWESPASQSRRRQSPASTPSRWKSPSWYPQPTTSPFASSSLSGGFGSPLKIEELIGSAWSQQEDMRDVEQQRQQQQQQDGQEMQQSYEQRQFNKAKRRRKKKKSSQSTESEISSKHSPPKDTSVVSIYPSDPDTVDAALHDFDTKSEQSSYRQRRPEEEGELMTPEFDGHLDHSWSERVDGTIAANVGNLPCTALPLGTWEEEGSDVNLALALDFDLIAKEDVQAGGNGDVDSRDDARAKLAQDPPQSLKDDDKAAEEQHLLRVDSAEMMEDHVHLETGSGILYQDQSMSDSLDSTKPNATIPIPTPQPIHPTVVATHSSSFDNMTNDDEDDLKPSTSFPMPSPQPARPDLSKRVENLPSKIPRLLPQHRGVDDTTTKATRNRVPSMGRRSKVHPTGLPEPSFRDFNFKTIKPRDTLKSSVEAMFKRSNSYDGESGENVAGQQIVFSGEKTYISTTQIGRIRSNSDAGRSSFNRLHSGASRGHDASSPKCYLTIQTVTSPVSNEAPLSTKSSRSYRRHHSGSSFGSDTLRSLDASPHLSASQRRKEYDAKLRADRATKLKRTDKKLLAEKREGDDTRHHSELNSLPTVKPPSQNVQSWERGDAPSQNHELQSPIHDFQITKDTVNDVVDLLRESLETSHKIYDDDVDAIVAAEMDESCEFEAAERLCSEIQSPLSHLRQKVSESQMQSAMSPRLLSHGEEETDAPLITETSESIAQKADDILSLCVDGQLLAEEDNLFYNAMDVTATAPVQRVLYQDNYEHAAALETEESREFAETELHCSGVSMSEDALENTRNTSTPQSFHDSVSHQAASSIQSFYRQYQMQSSRLSPSSLENCGDLLEPDLYEQVALMQQILEKYQADSLKNHKEQSSIESEQKQNYLDYYNDLMTLFNSKISEMKSRNMDSGASNAARIQRCIRALHIQKDYTRLYDSLGSLQTRIRCDHQCKLIDEKEKSQVEPVDTTHEMNKYYRGHMGVIVLQATFRGYRARRRLHLIEVHRLQLQAWARMVIDLRRYQGHLAVLKQLESSHSAAIKLQSCARSVVHRARFMKVKKSLIALQRFARAASLRRRQLVAIVKLQSFYRGAQQQQNWKKMRSRVIKMQASTRGMLALRRFMLLRARELLVRGHGCAVTIQACARGFPQRRYFKTMLRGFVRMQARVRGLLVRGRSAKVDHAIRVLQSFCVVVINTSRNRKAILQITALQAAVRGHIIRRSQFQARAIHFSKRRARVVKMQAAVRGIMQRRKFRRVIAGVTLFQARHRGAIDRMRLVKQEISAIKMQSLARGVLTREQMLAQHKFALLIQRTVRAFSQKLKSTKAIIVIQARFRGKQQRILQCATNPLEVSVQSFLRSAHESKHRRRILNGIVLLQARFRGRQSRFLACSKAAANVAWNDLVIASDKKERITQQRDTIDSRSVANMAAILLQSTWRAFCAKIAVAKKLLLSWRMDCYYPSHIQNKMSFLRAGILVLKLANKGNEVLQHVTSITENDSYTDIHWRKTMSVDLSSAFGRKTGTFNSRVTLLVKFRRRRTELFCKSHEHFVRATLLYALEREIKSLELKSKELIHTFIQTAVVNTRTRKFKSFIRIGETEMARFEVSATKLQRFWRSCLYVLSASEHQLSLTPLSSRSENLRQLCQNCIRLQAVIRGFLLRLLIKLLSGKAAIIQRAWNAYISTSKLNAQFPTINYLPSICIIQRKWKAKSTGANPQPESVTSTSSNSSVHSTTSPFPSPKSSEEDSNAKALHTRKEASVILQSYFRMFISRRKYHSEAISAKAAAAALVIQSFARKSISLSRYHTLLNGTIALQALLRGGNARMAFYVMYAAAIKLQSFARNVLAKQANALTPIDEVLYPLTKLQATFRCHGQRTQFMTMKKGFVLFQARVRGLAPRWMLLNARGSIILIQSIVRGLLARAKYNRVIVGMYRIQARIRGCQQKNAYRNALDSAVAIQGAARRSSQRQMFCAVRRRIVLLQAAVRGALQRSRVHSHDATNPSVANHAVKIQAFARKSINYKLYTLIRCGLIKFQAIVRGKQARTLAIKMETSAVFIQCWARASLHQVQLREFCMSARTIQRAWLKHHHTKPGCDVLFNRHLSAFVRSIVTLQKRWRLYQNVLMRNTAAKKLQRLIKTRIASREFKLANDICARNDYTVIRLQSLFRAWTIRKDVKSSNESAAVIQQCYRKHLPNARKASLDRRATYSIELRLKHENAAAVLMQLSARMCLGRRRAVSRDLCAKIIQSNVRSWLSSRAEKELKSAIDLVTATSSQLHSHDQFTPNKLSLPEFMTPQKKLSRVAQSRVDNLVKLQKEKAEIGNSLTDNVAIQIQSSVVIQVHVRMFLIRSKSSRLHQNALVIQRVWKNRRVEENIERYDDYCQAISKMQARWRLIQKPSIKSIMPSDSVVVLQAKWRGVLERRQETRLIKAALVIQKCWMRHRVSNPIARDHEYRWYVSGLVSFHEHIKVMRYKTNAVRTNAAVTKIQSCVRTHQAASRYSLLIRSSITIQAFSRMHKSQHLFRKMLQKKSSAVRLQSFVRASNIRARFTRQTEAAVVIQSRFRASVSKRRLSQCIQSVSTLQSFARMLRAKNIRNIRMQNCLVLQRAFRDFLSRCSLSDLSNKAAVIHRAWLLHRKTARNSNRTDCEEYDRFVKSLVSIQRLIKRLVIRRQGAAKKIQVLYFSWRMRMSLSKVLNSVVRVQKISRGYLSRIERERYHAAVMLQRFYWTYCAELSADSDDYLSSESLESDEVSTIESGTETEPFSEENDSTTASSDIELNEKSQPPAQLESILPAGVDAFCVSGQPEMEKTSNSESNGVYKTPSDSIDELPPSVGGADYMVQFDVVKNKIGADDAASACADNTLEKPITLHPRDAEYEENLIFEQSIHDSAVLLQRIARGVLARREVFRLNKASVTLQHAWGSHRQDVQMSPQSNKMKIVEGAVIILQYKWRNQMKSTVHTRELAATKIQSLIRMQLQHRTLLILSEEAATRVIAAVRLQSAVRGNYCRRQLSSYASHAIKIQRYFREYMHGARTDLMLKKIRFENELQVQARLAAATTIQSVVRSRLYKCTLSSLANQKSQGSAIRIQSTARRVLVISAVSSQRYVTVDQANKTAPTPLEAQADAARKIQRLHRLHMGCCNDDLAITEKAVTKLQMFLRRYMQSCHRDRQQAKSRSAIIIQSAARTSIACNELLVAKTACNRIQSCVRRHLYQKSLERKLTNAVVLQSWFRMLSAKSIRVSLELEMNARKKVDILKRKSAVALQRVVRGFIVRQKMSTVINAARVIQRARRGSVIRLRNKLLRVFHEQLPSDETHPVFKRSNSALLPRDARRLNRVREIAPHLPRENGVFVEVILNSVAVAIQSSARRYLAVKQYSSKLEEKARLQGVEHERQIQPSQVQDNYADQSSKSIRRRCISPSIVDVEDSVHFTQDEDHFNSRVVRIQSIFRGSHVRKEQSICNSSAAILQSFLRRHHKPKCKSESSDASMDSACSKSSNRMSTEDENHALMEDIYQQAEAQAGADSNSCVSRYAWRLLLATEQELLFDG